MAGVECHTELRVSPMKPGGTQLAAIALYVVSSETPLGPSPALSLTVAAKVLAPEAGGDLAPAKFERRWPASSQLEEGTS